MLIKYLRKIEQKNTYLCRRGSKKNSINISPQFVTTHRNQYNYQLQRKSKNLPTIFLARKTCARRDEHARTDWLKRGRQTSTDFRIQNHGHSINKQPLCHSVNHARMFTKQKPQYAHDWRIDYTTLCHCTAGRERNWFISISPAIRYCFFRCSSRTEVNLLSRVFWVSKFN